MLPVDARLTRRPRHFVCPSCRLHLLVWDPPTGHVELFHKVGLWADFWSGQVRLVCQYCLGATEALPQRLVRLLRERMILPVPQSGVPEPVPGSPSEDADFGPWGKASGR